MVSKIVWIAPLCSIPLILLIVVPQGDTDCTFGDDMVLADCEIPVMPQENTDCTGNAMCLNGKITRIIDGDTLDVDGNRIRLSLTSTPELDRPEGVSAKQFVGDVCPIGSDALVDEDDGQTEGSYGRILAKVHCQGIMLNEEILEHGHGEINTTFCSKSEFGNEAWAVKYGC